MKTLRITSCLSAAIVAIVLFSDAAAHAGSTFYVSADNGLTIYKVNSSGSVSDFVTEPPNTTLKSIAVDASGNVWAETTAGGGKITEYSPSGQVITTMPTYPPNQGVSGTGSISFDAQGNILEAQDGKTFEISTTGNLLFSYTNYNGSPLSNVAAAPNGDLFTIGSPGLAQTGLVMWSPSNATPTLIASLPYGNAVVATDAQNNVYVGEVHYNYQIGEYQTLIEKFSSSGLYLGTILDAIGANYSVTGLQVDPSGNVFAAVSFYGTGPVHSDIMEYSPNGTLLATFASSLPYDITGFAMVGAEPLLSVPEPSSALLAAIGATFMMVKFIRRKTREGRGLAR